MTDSGDEKSREVRTLNVSLVVDRSDGSRPINRKKKKLFQKYQKFHL